MTERSSIFDMIGPVMIGPSSSHTAGVARIGRLTRRMLGEPVSSAQITFYNSFATTYEGHGSDRALLAGLMDLAPNDERIREARALAEQVGLAFTIKAIGSAAKLHPNSVRIHAEGATRHIEVLGVSRGGGLVTIAEVDGFAADVSGQSFTLFVRAADVPGSIAFIASVVTHEQCNIATMNVSRKAKHSDAGLILELDSPLRPTTLDYLAQLHWVQSVNYIEPIS